MHDEGSLLVEFLNKHY